MPDLKTLALPATLLFLLVAALAVFAGDGSLEDGLARMIRVTATSSMLLFSLAFTASALHQLLPGGRWQGVLRARRRIGLSFALSHSAHLLSIIALVELVHGGDYSVLGDIAAGSVIYVFIYLMAATSNDASVRRLGPRNWKRLHYVGAYLVWIGLFGTYIGKAMETGAPHYWLFFALGVSLVLVRAWAYWNRRRAAQ